MQNVFLITAIPNFKNKRGAMHFSLDISVSWLKHFQMDANCISLPVLVTCAMTIQLNSILFFSSNNCTHSPLITLIPDNFTPLIFPGLLQCCHAANFVCVKCSFQIPPQLLNKFQPLILTRPWQNLDVIAFEQFRAFWFTPDISQAPVFETSSTFTSPQNIPSKAAGVIKLC